MLDATGDELPKNGFDAEDKGFQEPAADGRGVE
jgi:aconitate hydratase